MLTSFQTLMSALKILTTVAKGTQLVQIPKDPSLALVILDLLGMDTTAQVIQVNQRKLSAVSTSKTPQLPASKAISSVTRPISYYSTRGGVFSWSRSVDSPNFNFTCIIFFSWQWITFFTVFSAFFLNEYSRHSQFSIPTVILKLYFVSPHLHILPQHKQRRIMNMVFIPFQTSMSAIKILTTVARRTPLV